jgi:hypothetical protein
MIDVTEDWDHDEPGLPTADELLLRELTERARAGGRKLTGGRPAGQADQDGGSYSA